MHPPPTHPCASDQYPMRSLWCATTVVCRASPTLTPTVQTRTQRPMGECRSFVLGMAWLVLLTQSLKTVPPTHTLPTAWLLKALQRQHAQHSICTIRHCLRCCAAVSVHVFQPCPGHHMRITVVCFPCTVQRAGGTDRVASGAGRDDHQQNVRC